MSELNVNIYSGNSFLCFDLESTLKLREPSSRLCPRLIGSYSNTATKSQASISSIPSQLSAEELGILIEKKPDCLQLFSGSRLLDDSSPEEFKSQFEAYSKQFTQNQIQSYRELRKNQLVSMRKQIIEGKRKKLQSQLAKETNETKRNEILKYIDNLDADFESELSKVDKLELNESSTNTEIFVKTPDFYRCLFSPTQVSIQDFWLNYTHHTCRYQAFRSLWEKGFYLTSGVKFGGDFLVYPGDPASYHSQYILVCMEDSPSLTLKQLITYARMATSVKKTFLIAFIKNSTTLNFLSINWSHI